MTSPCVCLSASSLSLSPLTCPPRPQSRIHHETGLRHKGNYERYIREVYRKGMTDKKDRAHEARELARVEAVRFWPGGASLGPPPWGALLRCAGR